MTLKTFEIYIFYNRFMKKLAHIDGESSATSAAHMSDGIRGALLEGMVYHYELHQSLVWFSTFLIKARLIQLNQSYLEQGDD